MYHVWPFLPVDGGHRAVIFDRFTGVKNLVVGEGTHFFIPWVQRPIIFDIRSRPRNIPTVTGSKGKLLISYLYLKTSRLSHEQKLVFLSVFVSDLQNVNITLRILFRPVPDQLPKIYTILGVDYDERVLPSITTEVLKAVVVSSLYPLLLKRPSRERNCITPLPTHETF